MTDPLQGPVTGVDVASVDRIARALRRHPAFGRRCFTAAEAAVSRDRPERWAGRWAVKEAVRKVYGGRGWALPPYRAIEVVRPPGRGPRALVFGEPVPGLAVSLTHDAGVAIAVAVHCGGGRLGALPPALAQTARALRLRPRAADAHKGSFGTVVVVAGHTAFPGAAVLSALGALRGGAGKVRAVVPVGPGGPSHFPPEVMLRTVAAGSSGGFAPAALPGLVGDLDSAQALALGPGLGQAAETAAFLGGLLELLGGRGLPLVLDADGLNLCAADPQLLRAIPPGTVCTPHPAEMGRLLGRSVALVQGARADAARELSSRLRSVVVLKGAGTVVAGPDGAVSVDPHATSVLATGGSGDVLTGLIAALLAQGLPAHDAARAGVFIHGEAGRALQQARGRAGLLASEVADRCVDAQEELRRALEAARPS